MASYELIMPKMGESITEATILKWLKKEGDTIQADEAVLEMATDKVDSELPSPVSGTLVKAFYNEGDVVAVGKPVALIETAVTSPLPIAIGTLPKERERIQTTEQAAPVQTVSKQVTPSQPSTQPTSDRFYSPLVLNIARQEGISMAELEGLTGTGANGRVTKKDILEHVEKRHLAPARQIVDTPIAPVVTTKSYSGNVEIMEMDRMRRLIADNMVRSKQTSAHVTSFVEADVTNIVAWRNRMKKKFQELYGENLTFTPIFIEAVVRALRDFPLVNSSIDGANVLIKKDLNIGMATALPSGNLIVPVIRNADQLNIVGLAKKVNDLAGRARTGKLKPDEIEGGTFTLSNVGTFGNVMGTPIIMQPQVAILAVGVIKKKPVVLETEYGDVIGIRQMMFLSHSYDHRIVDGALGGSFVRRVADYLEKWDGNREI
jgi:2-oxoglutarate dehydrogenase E2 component (dihydrolipoamide succinyltransferase)